MKRIIAILLVIATLISTLSGCMATTSKTAMTMGQWVTLIADSFGLQNYTDETPHFTNVSTKDTTFSAFQAVAEWNIINPTNDITSSTPVKWNDVLISLVNAGEFLDNDATDKEKIDFAIENFDSSIRKYWGNRYIKMTEAIPLLDTAQEMWANKVFLEKIEKATFAENVTNCIDNKEIDYIANGDVITTTSKELSELKVGDVYTLPANNSESASINKVKTIENIDGKIVITNDNTFTDEDAAEYVQEIRIQETSSPDFTQIAGIYDEFGNPINYEIDNSTSADGMSSTNKDYSISTLAYNPNNTEPQVQQLGLFDNVKGSLKFKVGEYSVSLTTTKNNFSVKLAKEISKTTNRYREQKQEAYVKTTINNVELTKDVDYSWGVLHSATVKLDYDATVEGGIKTERKGKIGDAVGKGEGKEPRPISSILSDYKNALTDLNKDIRNSKCKDKIYICKLSLIEGGLASVDFIVKGEVTAEGDIKIVVEIEGSQGIQVKDGKFRYIKNKDIDVDFAAEAKLEVTIAPGVEITLLKKFALITLTVDFGVGASVEMIAHLFDIEGHELYSGTAQISSSEADDLANEELYTTAEEIEKFAMEKGGSWDAEKKGITGHITLHKGVCLKWKLYPIVRFGIDGQSLVGKIAKKFKVTLTVEILGSKNTILQGHIDFPNNLKNMVNSDSVAGGLSALLGINAECTYDYKPWDEAVEEVDKLEEEEGIEGSTSEIERTETITLSTMRVEIDEGKSAQISVTGLPDGYELKDIEAESEEPDIASFNIREGKITGVKEGITRIIVKTKDGKHKAYCAVVVTTDEKIEFNELPTGSEV